MENVCEQLKKLQELEKRICEDLEKQRKQKKLYICEVSRKDLYDLYITVCFELRMAYCSLKYREKHRSSERIDMLRIDDARSRVWAVKWIYRVLKSVLPRSVWFAFKRRYKREKKRRGQTA